ncbi:Phosphorylase b kinase regulatory subunit alpha, partial [Borealophlyctis nickersoniae]
MHLKQWSIVRQAAGLLKKCVNNLAINVSDLLIRLKPVTVGFGGMEYFITSPVSPVVLVEIIYKHCASDVREAPLVQEVLIYLGSFIRSSSSMFDGIMRIRTHFFIIAMREEISRIRGCDEEEAVEHLMQLSPFEMKSLLGQVLAAHDQTTSLPAPLTHNLSSQFRWRAIHVNSSESALRLSEMGANLPTELVISAQSGGFHSGNFSRIDITRDGQPQPLRGFSFGRGLNVVIVDPFDGSVLERATFDTHISQEESNEFARLVEWLDPGTIVIIVVKDDGAENLTDAARLACESLGSARVRELFHRDSWCLLGEKGANMGSVPEAHMRADAGPTETVQRVVDLGSKRRSVLASTAAMGVANGGGQRAAATLLLPSQGRWLRRRKNDGALNRVPKDFYPKVWKVLSQTKGILIGKELLPRDPTVSEKTPEEFNFALQTEHLLDVIPDPAERQIAVECLMVISSLGERNPELQLSGEKTVDLVPIIRDAITRFWDAWVAEQQTTNGFPVDASTG